MSSFLQFIGLLGLDHYPTNMQELIPYLILAIFTFSFLSYLLQSFYRICTSIKGI